LHPIHTSWWEALETFWEGAVAWETHLLGSQGAAGRWALHHGEEVGIAHVSVWLRLLLLLGLLTRRRLLLLLLLSWRLKYTRNAGEARRMTKVWIEAWRRQRKSGIATATFSAFS